jgi:hypothetical protein
MAEGFGFTSEREGLGDSVCEEVIGTSMPDGKDSISLGLESSFPEPAFIRRALWGEGLEGLERRSEAWRPSSACLGGGDKRKNRKQLHDVSWSAR